MAGMLARIEALEAKLDGAMAILVLLERDVWGSARPSMDSKLVHASWQSRACPGQLVLATAPTSRSGVSTCPSTCASSRSPSSGASSCPSPGRSSPPRCGARSHRADGSSGASAYRRHRGIFWRPPIGEAGGYRATHSHHVIDGPPEQLPQQFSMVDSSDKSTDTHDLTGPWEPMGSDAAANGSADASADLSTDFGTDAVQPEDLLEELPEDQLKEKHANVDEEQRQRQVTKDDVAKLIDDIKALTDSVELKPIKMGQFSAQPLLQDSTPGNAKAKIQDKEGSFADTSADASADALRTDSGVIDNVNTKIPDSTRPPTSPVWTCSGSSVS
mmetsp:Transcript_6240/g.20053  ORF Transcript_6240/g.20053 Transcript_6240/m.20053 type:complete len:330 (+) Transcript_6240:95-1084(+)